MSYEKKLEQINVMENRWQDACNQTEIYNLVMRHFTSPLPEGKKVKKAIVVGYDGCTAEMLDYLDREDNGTIKYILENGGHCVFSYAGGKPYPEPIIQETSTAPGWCAMLTGVTCEENGIDDNGFVKELEPKSLFLKLPEADLVKSAAFYVSWDGHFTEDNSTYLKEKQYIAEKKLDVTFLCADGDDGTRKNVLDDINRDDCSDFIFLILEYTDHNGHGYDYRPEVPEYMQAFLSEEEAGYEFIEAIKKRKSFDEEDWLVLVTSDHGGYKCSHGGETLQERITFIASNHTI
ncbi:MAG: alkaline phosphatase family protein [Eubacterium sp.]|nr:alkaline phosphatase family protein [Eubacterium sp.]